MWTWVQCVTEFKPCHNQTTLNRQRPLKMSCAWFKFIHVNQFLVTATNSRDKQDTRTDLFWPQLYGFPSRHWSHCWLWIRVKVGSRVKVWQSRAVDLTNSRRRESPQGHTSRDLLPLTSPLLWKSPWPPNNIVRLSVSLWIRTCIEQVSALVSRTASQGLDWLAGR